MKSGFLALSGYEWNGPFRSCQIELGRVEIVGVVAAAVTWPAAGSRPRFCELSPRLSCRSLPGAPAAPRAQRPSPSPLLLNHHSSKAGSGYRPGLLGILVVTSPFSSGVSPTEAEYHHVVLSSGTFLLPWSQPFFLDDAFW